MVLVQYYIPIGGGSEDFEVLVFKMKDRSISLAEWIHRRYK
jgi:hypothetical protein